MTPERLYEFILQYHNDVNFVGRYDSDGTSRHCGRHDCDTCPFTSLDVDLCYLCSKHYPPVSDVITSIRPTNPELFI